MKKQLHRSVKGVQNVYTQHTPFLLQTVEAITKGTLPEVTAPHAMPAIHAS